MIWRGLALGALMLAGCATPQTDEQGLHMRLEQRGKELGVFLADVAPLSPEAGLLVHLAFGPEADLDLYVTDPQLETVYFANHEAKSGGQISADGRCGAQAIQMEQVRFKVPKPGRYRVGIDYPQSCNGTGEPAAHAVSVFYNGQRLGAQGFVSLQQFEVIVLEFDIDAMKIKEVSK